MSKKNTNVSVTTTATPAIEKPNHNMAICFRNAKEAAEARQYVGADADYYYGQLEMRAKGEEGKVMYVSHSEEGDNAIIAIAEKIAKANVIFKEEKKFAKVIQHSVTLDWNLALGGVNDRMVKNADGSLSVSMGSVPNGFFPFTVTRNYNRAEGKNVDGWHFGMPKAGVITVTLNVDGTWTITDEPWHCTSTNEKVNRAVGLEWSRIVKDGQTEPIVNCYDDTDVAANYLFSKPQKAEWFKSVVKFLEDEMASELRIAKRMQDDLGLNTLAGRAGKGLKDAAAAIGIDVPANA